MNRLDVTHLPLTGLQLIEASAGTGKTHAITTLYLRLLLETPRSVRDLLVVTFTHAATEELRGRIRRRLLDAQRLLNNPALLAAEKDAALRDVLQQQIAAGNAESARRKLAVMISAIDEAGIFTIHSFCQRALREHAFESGETFTAELTESQQEIVEEAVIDWWRQRFYADAALASFAASRRTLATPAAVMSWLKDVLTRDVEVRVPDCDLDALKVHAGALKARWPDERDALISAINDSPWLSKKRDGTMLKDFATAIAALDAWVAGHDMAPAQSAEKIGQANLDAQVTEIRRKKGGAAPSLPFARELDALFQQLTALELALLAEAREDCRRRSDVQKRRANVLAFDDLILRLRAALRGAGGERLAARIAAQFPAAMIDEFQDTDPAQYDIFESIYRGRANSCLLMIGDPKQAIYSFRGADIYAYVRARHDTPAAQRHTMTTNWRSARALVAGIDALFARIPEPFLMGEDVGWVTVDAAGHADESPLLVDAARPVPLQFWINDDNDCPNKDDYRADAAAAVATRCVQLLNAAQAGNATLEGRALTPRDIAILVRSHREAALVQDTLLARGIGSAINSQHSVLDSAEAADFSCVLDALLDPGNERALRRALVTPLWGMSANALADWQASDDAREKLREDLHNWHQLWVRRGFMPMFRQWLHRAQIPANLLARPRGERALTNLLHLAELLQRASIEHASPDELRRWFAQARTDNGNTPQEQQLRLESDENLVQVVTLHKSKGLEYPVVFLPFCGLESAHGESNFRDDKPLYHDSAADHRLVLDYRDTETAMSAAARESLAENMRLLYVGLTRAKYLCCVNWGALSGFSALALLLHGEPGDSVVAAAERYAALKKPDKKNPGKISGNRAVLADVQRLAEKYPQSIAVMQPPHDTARYLRPAVNEGDWSVRRIGQAPPRDFQITSFSRLAQQAHALPGTPPDMAGGAGSAVADAISAFPRGTRAGHFFHELLEDLDFPAARGEVLNEAIAQQSLRHGIAASWQKVVAANITDVLDTPLHGDFTLRTLTAERRRNECEFYYPVSKLDNVLLERTVPGLAALDSQSPRFTFSQTSGLMHGFIDLLFEHQGRWYVADWKTNWLGVNAGHYVGATLDAAMRQHAYDLQYWVYTLALHRHLQQKLGAQYDYDRHVGGVYYFFLRGMRPENGMRSGVVFARPPRAQLQALDNLVRGEQP